jgi:hypothetical protein
MENLQPMKFGIRLGCQTYGTCLVEPVDASGQGLPGPAKQQEVLEFTAIIVVWQNQMYQAETYGDVVSLHMSQLVVNVLFMRWTPEVSGLYAFGNKRISVSR